MENSFLEKTKFLLKKIVTENRLEDTQVTVLVKTLTPEEAIGEPGRRDYPIVQGKERMVEATVLGTRAHAFTDSPGEFIGNLGEILTKSLSSNKERAIYVSTLNAVLKHLNLVERTIHCRDEDPERCAKEIAAHVLERWGKVTVGLIGMNPAIAELTRGLRVGSDFPAPNATDLSNEMVRLRVNLTPEEGERARALGRACAEAMDAAILF